MITNPVGAILTSQLKGVIGWYGMFFMVSAFSFSSKWCRYSRSQVSSVGIFILKKVMSAFSFSSKWCKHSRSQVSGVGILILK